MRWPILQMCISRCEKPLHHWSDALKSSFSQSWNRVTVKIWSQYLQYLQSYLEIFIRHLAAAVPLLETDNISPVWRHIIEIWPVLMACTWKNPRRSGGKLWLQTIENLIIMPEMYKHLHTGTVLFNWNLSRHKQGDEGWKRLTARTNIIPVLALWNPKKFILNPRTRE